MIRPAVVQDLDSLINLEQQAFPGDRISRRSFRHLLTRARALTLVDEHDGRLRGYVLLLFRRGLSLARLYSIAVADGCRGQGVGAGLVRAAEQAALERDCVMVRLEIRRDNEASQTLFRGLGYHAFAVTPAYYQDAMDALRFEKHLVPELNPETLRVRHYRQTLEFTCGPACLLMAMQAQDRAVQPDRIQELRLWREATTIFMTSGHGGCSPHGLALAAHRRGFAARLYLSTDGPLFLESVRSVAKKEVIALVQEDFIAQAQAAGIASSVGNVSLAALEAELEAGGIPLVLISSYRLYREKGPHWVVLSGMDRRFCYITDPYVDEDAHRSAADCLHAPVPRAEFERMARYGRNNEQAVVVVGPRGH